MSTFTIVQPTGRPLTGGDLLAQSLRALGVDVAFGIQGGHLDAFLLGCEQFGIRLVDVRHETVGVQAAEGYSKVTGKVGACFVTANSGFANGLPGLITAHTDRSAICCIATSQPTNDIDTNGLQGGHDQVLIVKPFTKFAHRVSHGEEIPRLVAHAFQVAASGAPGPVFIDVPLNILATPVPQDRIALGSIGSLTAFVPSPSLEATAASVALWKDAKRPLIIAGTGARMPKSVEFLSQVAESTGTPVFHSTNYSSVLPVNHPLQAGFANRLAILPMTNQPVPDLVILIGARPGTFLGGRKGRVLPQEGCKYIQIDTDGAELGKIQKVDIGIVSDAEQALRALYAEIQKTPFTVPQEWAKTALGLRKIQSPFENVPDTTAEGKIHPYHAMKRVFSSLEPGAIICADGGESAFWAIDLAEHANPHISMYTCGYLGFLGNGWGYALGAAVGAPERQVINVQGDGSAGFHIAELDTYARFGLNILTVILNNDVWGMSLHAQNMVFGDKIKERPASSLSAGARYELVAQGLQNEAARVTKFDEIEKVVKHFSGEKRPGCINLVVSESPAHPGLEALVLNALEPNKITVPYFG